MPREKSIVVSGLHLNASPHPEGVYISLLRQASASHVLAQARASDYGKLTTPRRYERADHLFSGRILLWTDIDVRGRWLDLSHEDELPKSLKDLISIPDNAKPNYRTFNYVFDNSKHTLWFETKNEFDETLGPSTARRLIAGLLSREVLGLDSPEVEVTVVPEEGTVRRILALKRLRTLTIRVSRPNADVSSPEARRRVFRELEAYNAQRMELKLTKSADAPRLTSTQRIEELATVGADTGFVKAEAIDENGKPIVIATDDTPKKIHVEMSAGGSFISRLLSSLRL